MASNTGGSSSGNANNGSGSLARDDSKWYFTAEQLANSPSRKCGMDADQELMYRQRAANLIQDMGQRLQVSQLCINTAIVYMHRFYAFHSFTQFHRNSIAAAALFLAAKVEEQPRKLEHIIKVVHICLALEAPDPLKENYAEQAQDLVFNENVLLQTLGFDVAIDHPHTHVVKTCHLVKASKDLAQTSYFMASNSLHLTTMCLQYKPTVVACFCIHLACKWSRWEIPQSNEGRHWFHYVDKTVTLDLLKQLTDEFLHIFDRCPTRLKSKMKSIRADQALTDDSSRRSGTSNSGMPCPSSSLTARPIDDGGSSSSSHHRSSSHSQHSHSKQSSSSGDTMLKPSSSSQKVPSSSSSSSSRSRSERPSSSSSQQLHQQQMMTSSAHYGSSGANVKMPPMPHHSSGSSSRSNMPPQSSASSSSSSRAGYMHDNARDPKNRMMPTAATGSSSSSMQMHPYGQNKMDRHSSSNNSQKNQTLPHMDSSKNPMKPQGSMAPLFGSSQEVAPRTSSSSMMKQPQAPYGSHPPSYSQSMSSRNNNLPSSESVSVPNQPQQYKNQLQQQHPPSAESSFRLIDDSNRLTDHIPMCTPPKQSKPSSIFSPDWKDTQAESNNGSITNAITSNSGGKSRSQTQLTGATKTVKESPSSKERKPLPLSSYPDQQQQQQQQHQKQRSETPKKERRADPFTAQSGGTHQSRSSEKKSSSSSSSGSLKRSLESTSAPPMPLAMSGMADVDLLGLNKPAKRSLPSNEQIRQDDGTDFRENKIRKVEPQSPSEQLFSSSFDLSNTFDKQDEGFSLFAFNDPGSLLSQPLLSDSKPMGASKNNFPNTINGIETNPALVSSLLKESLCSNDSKFGTLSSGGSNTAMTGNATASNSMASLSSTSSMSIPSMLSTLSNVPETIKTEAPPVDVNAPSAISSLLAQSVTSLNPITSTGSATQHLTTAATSGSAASMTSGSGEIQTLTGETLAIPSKDDEHHRSKSEKKKKKDKHKHKEKDKSKDKDREDRKKHKKDKDRHRERDKSENSGDPTLSNPPPGPIKIKLPKDKLNLPANSNPHASDSGLKIKIPKDRLSGASSLSTTATGQVSTGTSSAGESHQIPAPNPLKLKISKDKIEHYNISTSDEKPYNSGPGHGHASGGGGGGNTSGSTNTSSSSSSHHGHGSKKKDREKSSKSSSKSSTSGDYSKQNGNSGSSASGSSSSKSSSNKQNTSSTQQQKLPSINAIQSASGLGQYPASFDYMQHAQAPMLQQQQHQFFNQFGTGSAQPQQQMQPQLMINSSGALKIPMGNPPPYFYNSSNQNNGKK
ncbi:cyclin-T-like [Toxorhynchites rutilus septentrionalis]|uniref:cyclin-T-like n=1 Tax=Toxorhynchites rutilus septentrionalis TaxID=329112 RepID=UPI002478B0FC|nr:cyclin-T-like [Toxorhynchites rutilus septentrionalis]